MRVDGVSTHTKHDDSKNVGLFQFNIYCLNELRRYSIFKHLMSPGINFKESIAPEIGVPAAQGWWRGNKYSKQLSERFYRDSMALFEV